MKFLMTILLAFGLASCGRGDQSSRSSTLALSTDNLWAGQVIAVSERSTADACAYGRGKSMDYEDYSYGGWNRQRAAFTNICFEVWMPGVTDQDHPDFWRQLDVQVHYRYEGQAPFQTQYVNSIGREGNNRRYAWDMRQHDPFRSSAAPRGIPYRELNRWTDNNGQVWARVEALLEFYVTINGKELKKPDGWPFYILYTDATVFVR